MRTETIPTELIFGIPVARLTMLETLLAVEEAIEDKRQIHHIVVNAGKIVSMQKDPELRDSVLEADLINADGMAVVWASKLLGKSLPERVAGIDLMENLVKMAHENRYKVFFLGAREEVVKQCVDHYSELYSPALVAGYQNGYFTKEEEADVAAQIADSGANILFVAMTSPMKEIFLEKYKQVLSRVNMIMGVGGSFDVVAGKVKRAPVWMQKAGLEWFYRFIQEPKRMWKRYLVGNSKFMMLTLKEVFSPVRYPKAKPVTT
ncbi:MAG: WecB/TagA/CpsF family glycosyltransferase [Flavobacteriales bacterium]|nr:WecB/TagA/CpsF family glycosyltransferase [Flavobacteriales bacterium]